MTEEMTGRRWHVVIENPDDGAARAQMEALEAEGLSVRRCGGPDATGDLGCPVLREERCPLIEAADVVVHDLDLDDPEHRRVLTGLRVTHPEVPVVLEVPQSTARQHADVLQGVAVVYPYDMDRLVQAVIAAASSRSAAPSA